MIVPRRSGLALLATACMGGAAGVAELALRTGEGARLDGDVFARVRADSVQPVVAGVGQRALDEISVGSIALVLGVLAVVALATHRSRAALEAVAIVALSVGTSEALKRTLAEHEVARVVWRGTWPSGHATVAASLGLALVAAVPPRLKPAAALAGALYAAGIGAAVVLLGWHLPSDVVGAFLVAGFWASAVLFLAGRARVRSPVSPASVAVALLVAVGAAAVLAYLAAHHPFVAQVTLSARALVAAFFLFGAVVTVLFATVATLAGEEAAP